jgi:sugar O-acyltransferase (sialic acid O-acetyltransferase NeuD family)
VKLAIIGAGGHAKVVADTAILAGWEIIGFADDRAEAKLFNFPYLGKVNTLKLPENTKAVVAIGANRIRERIASTFASRLQWATIIHPRAIVSSRAKIDVGTVVFAGAVIQADTMVGRHCIINTLASVDHDCSAEDYCHIAPNATLTGSVVLEIGAFVGAGSTIIPGCRMEKWSTLGAGAVLVSDLEQDSVFAGIPARKLRSS